MVRWLFSRVLHASHPSHADLSCHLPSTHRDVVPIHHRMQIGTYFTGILEMNRAYCSIVTRSGQPHLTLEASIGFLRDFGVRQPDGSYALKSSDTSLFASIVQAGGGWSVSIARDGGHADPVMPPARVLRRPFRWIHWRLERPEGSCPCCHYDCRCWSHSPAYSRWIHPAPRCRTFHPRWRCRDHLKCCSALLEVSGWFTIHRAAFPGAPPSVHAASLASV